MLESLAVSAKNDAFFFLCLFPPSHLFQSQEKPKPTQGSSLTVKSTQFYPVRNSSIGPPAPYSFMRLDVALVHFDFTSMESSPTSPPYPFITMQGVPTAHAFEDSPPTPFFYIVKG